jgi:cobalt-zinc-cadmium efflux system protein
VGSGFKSRGVYQNLSPDESGVVSQTRRLAVVLALNLALVAGLAVAGLMVGSVSLLAAAADCVADSFALGLGLLAVHLRDHHGRAGATNVVALVNVVVLLVVAVTVVTEAGFRLLGGAPVVDGAAVLVAGVVTAVVLGIGALVLGSGGGHEDVHMRSVLLDTAFDCAAAAGVAVAGLVIAVVRGAYWLDPVVAAVIAVLVGVGAVRLLVDVVAAIRGGEVVDVD